MARFSSRDGQGYRAIRGVLSRFVGRDLEDHNPHSNAIDLPGTYSHRVLDSEGKLLY